LSWNWGQDLLREVLEEAGLKDMVEEIFPFTAEYSHKLVTIIDPEDIKDTEHWSDETLVEHYYRTRGLKYERKLTKDEKAKIVQEEKAKLKREAE
jgi:hypothetical protein